MMKLCTICHQYKEPPEFVRGKNCADGYRNKCKACNADCQFEWKKKRGLVTGERRDNRRMKIEGLKRCAECKEVKSVDEFDQKSGFSTNRSQCKKCRAKEHRLRYKTDEIYRKKRNLAGLEDNRKSPRQTLRRAINNALKRCPTQNPITVDGLMAMWTRQSGRCALSGVQMTWANGANSHQRCHR